MKYLIQANVGGVPYWLKLKDSHYRGTEYEFEGLKNNATSLSYRTNAVELCKSAQHFSEWPLSIVNYNAQ